MFALKRMWYASIFAILSAGCRESEEVRQWGKTGAMVIIEKDRIVAISDVRLPQQDNERLPQTIKHPITIQLGHFAAKEWPLRYFRAFISQLPVELNGLVLSTDFPSDRIAIMNSHFKCVRFLKVDVTIRNQIIIPLCEEALNATDYESGRMGQASLSHQKDEPE